MARARPPPVRPRVVARFSSDDGRVGLGRATLGRFLEKPAEFERITNLHLGEVFTFGADLRGCGLLSVRPTG
jgi:hypothetical protein